jgi:hypothetical protein
MKASAIGYGGILVLLIVTSLTIMYIIGAGEPVNRTIVTVEGAMMSFESNVNNFIKSYDQGIIFISQKAAYDLGKTGGMRSEVVWTSTYPTMSDFENELEETIKERMPSLNTQDSLEITFGDKSVNVNSYDELPCNTGGGSKCFNVTGKQIITLYKRTVDSTVRLNPYKFNPNVSSNYFKLLEAGRAIMGPDFSDVLQNKGDLTNRFYALKGSGDVRFANLDIEAAPIASDPNTISVTIYEHCTYTVDSYCLSPLSPGESGDLSGIPYDYNKLIFKYQMEQTGNTPLTSNYALGLTSNAGTTSGSCPAPTGIYNNIM